MKKTLICRALLVTLAAVLLLMFATYSFGIGAEHECSDDVCHICSCLSLCASIVKTIAVILVVACVIYFGIRMGSLLCRTGGSNTAWTPIYLKVKLLN